MRLGSTSGAAAQIQAGAEHVVELARAGGAVVEGFAEVQAVADAAAVVDGQHDVALAGEVLIHRVGVVVVVHVVPAQQHLAARASVEEDQRRGASRRGRRSGGRKSWPWMRRPSAAEKITGCGVDQRAAGKSAGMESGARSRSSPCRRSGWRRARDACASERSMAIAAPSPVSTGDHSIPVAWRHGAAAVRR